MKMLPLALFLILCVALAFGLSDHNPKAPVDSPMVGQKPEAFSLPSLDDATYKLSFSTWKGKVVVVNAFASWCQSCMAEHPVLMKLKQSSDVIFVGLAWRDKPEKISAWLATHGNPFSAVMVDESGQSTMKLALSGVPETFILAKDGRIAYNHKSPVDDEEVEKVILPLVGRLENE